MAPQSSLPWPSDPHLRRWMVFVDGENFALRAKDFAASRGLELKPGRQYEPDLYVWMPETPPLTWLSGSESAELRRRATRAYYYTSVTGDTDRINTIRRALWELGFHPDVFKGKRGEKAKGVDIALSKDLLSHAYLDNYDVAVLVAGDGDYIPLVDEVKRRGKVVYGSFFMKEG
jgi:NYN domain